MGSLYKKHPKNGGKSTKIPVREGGFRHERSQKKTGVRIQETEDKRQLRKGFGGGVEGEIQIARAATCCPSSIRRNRFLNPDSERFLVVLPLRRLALRPIGSKHYPLDTPRRCHTNRPNKSKLNPTRPSVPGSGTGIISWVMVYAGEPEKCTE